MREVGPVGKKWRKIWLGADSAGERATAKPKEPTRWKERFTKAVPCPLHGQMHPAKINKLGEVKSEMGPRA